MLFKPVFLDTLPLITLRPLPVFITVVDVLTRKAFLTYLTTHATFSFASLKLKMYSKALYPALAALANFFGSFARCSHQLLM